MREFVEVSPEMTLLIGQGPLAHTPLPPRAIALGFNLDAGAPTLSFLGEVDAERLEATSGLLLVIERSAFVRIGGAVPEDEDEFHLPSALRAIALAVRDATLNGETLVVYRLGKSIELLCETIRHFDAGDLLPVAGEGVLSREDTRRLINARRMIDERWSEKLTLDTIARACGLNRAKLTRGFRDMFQSTIAEALAERRLSAASQMLLTTDLPVSSVGYENGYLNNASFARAFGRRFGVSPSSFRACQLAA